VSPSTVTIPQSRLRVQNEDTAAGTLSNYPRRFGPSHGEVRGDDDVALDVEPGIVLARVPG
jgi:hypothetical protein